LAETWFWLRRELGPGLSDAGGEISRFCNPAGDRFPSRGVFKVLGGEGETEWTMVGEVNSWGTSVHEGRAECEIEDRDTGRGKERARKKGGEEETVNFGAVRVGGERVGRYMEVGVFVLGGGIEGELTFENVPFLQKGPRWQWDLG
jgi:hypothetical protein